MRDLVFAGLLLFATAGSAPAQQAAEAPAQSLPPARSAYDPMAQGKAIQPPKGIVESTLAGINPRDKDYGEVIQGWRKEVFENTLYRVYFWGLVVLGTSLGVALAGSGWLLRERERRLAITADVITQLYNAYISSRAKALEVIAKYNALVDRYNKLDADRQRLTEQIAGLSEPSREPELDFNQAREDRNAAAAPPPMTVPPARTRETDRGEEKSEVETLRVQLAEVETKLERKTAQLQAKDNQIANLRERLSRAHDSLEGQRKAKAQPVQTVTNE